MNERLVREFERAATASEEDLAGAALAVARLEYPRLDVPSYISQLDRLGGTARARLRAAGGTGLAAAVQTLSAYVFEEEGFTGNETDYDDPRNSFLNEVLDRRTGIPLTLALVFLEVARRAGVPARGVSFPGHFLLRCDAAAETLFLDPFHQGARLTERDCRSLLRRHVGEEAIFSPDLLVPATKQQILCRLLTNLKRVYVRLRSFPQAKDMTELLLALDPSGVAELRDRGLLAYHLSDFSSALRDLEAYLQFVPRGQIDDDERKEYQQIWEHVKALRRRVASFN